MARWIRLIGFVGLSLASLPLPSLPRPIPRPEITPSSSSSPEEDEPFYLEDDIRLLPVLNSDDEAPHPRFTFSDDDGEEKEKEESSSSSTFSLDDDITIMEIREPEAVQTPSSEAVTMLVDYRYSVTELCDELVGACDNLLPCLAQLDYLTSQIQSILVQDYSGRTGLLKAMHAGDHLCLLVQNAKESLATLTAGNTNFLRLGKDLFGLRSEIGSLLKLEPLLRSRAQHVLNEISGQECKLEIQLTTVRRARAQYDDGLSKAATRIWQALADGYKVHEGAAALLEMELDSNLNKVIQDGVQIPSFEFVELKEAMDSYKYHFGNYDRIRSIAAKILDAIPTVGRTFLTNELENCIERFNALFATVELKALISLEAIIDPQPEKKEPAPVDMTIFDIHHENFDARQFRLHYLHYHHLRTCNIPTKQSDPVYAAHFTRLHASPSDSLEDEDSLDELQRIFEDDLDTDFFIEQLQALGDGEDSPSRQSPQTKSSVGDSKFIALMPGDIDVLMQAPEGLLFVNPMLCAHTQKRYIRPQPDIQQTLISPPPNLITDLSCRERLVTILITPNMHGFQQLRDAVMDQFVTAIRLHATGLVIGHFGCSGCGVTARHLAHIYREAMKIFAGHGLKEVYLCDEALWDAVHDIILRER